MASDGADKKPKRRGKGEGSVTKRSDGRYAASVRRKHGPGRVYRYALTELEAKLKLRELRSQEGYPEPTGWLEDYPLGYRLTDQEINKLFAVADLAWEVYLIWLGEDVDTAEQREGAHPAYQLWSVVTGFTEDLEF